MASLDIIITKALAMTGAVKSTRENNNELIENKS